MKIYGNINRVYLLKSQKSQKKYTLYAMLFYAMLFALYPLRCYAVSVNRSVKQGNRLYYEGKYDEALKHYNKAENTEVNSGIVNFNKGTALYQKKDYKGAIESFSEALLNSSSKIEEKAAYNIGNAKYRLGQVNKNTDLSSSIKLYREALDYYKRAMDLDQKDINAKYNYEFVERKLKILLDELKHRKKQPHQSSQNNKSHKQSHSSTRKQGKNSHKTKNKKREMDKKTVKNKQKQEGAAQNKGGNKKQKHIQKQVKGYKMEQGKISREEARMILDRYSQGETALRNMNNKRAQESSYLPVLKDW